MKKTLAAALIALLSSCAGTSIHRITDSSYGFVMPQDVRIFQTEDDIPFVFERLAVIYTTSAVDATDPGRMEKKVLSDAAEMGANGIVLEGEERRMPEGYEGRVLAVKVFHGVERQPEPAEPQSEPAEEQDQ